jgi:hypothetical protein
VSIFSKILLNGAKATITYGIKEALNSSEEWFVHNRFVDVLDAINSAINDIEALEYEIETGKRKSDPINPPPDKEEP